MSQGQPPDPWSNQGGQQPPPAYGAPGEQPPGRGAQPPSPGQPPYGQPPGYGGQQPSYGSQAPGAGLPYAQPGDQQGYWPYGQAGGAVARPGGVLAACIMSYIGGGFMALIGVFLLLGSIASSAFLEGAAESAGLQGISPGALLGIMIAFGAYTLLLGAAIIVCAVFAQKGKNGARIGLAVIGGLNVALGVVGVVTGAPQQIVTVAYIAVAVVLLFVGKANDWYAQQRSV